MAIKKSDLYASLWASCDELRDGMDPAARRPADQQIILLNRETALGRVPGSSMMDGHQ